MQNCDDVDLHKIQMTLLRRLWLCIVVEMVMEWLGKISLMGKPRSEEETHGVNLYSPNAFFKVLIDEKNEAKIYTQMSCECIVSTSCM